MTPTETKLLRDNTDRWSHMVINPHNAAEFELVAKRLVQPYARARYLDVQEQTGVPWYIIAVIHEREAQRSWLSNIAQGDPWNEPSRHSPKGRGPFDTWEQAAIDAMKNCPPYAAKWKDWSVGGGLVLLEVYNGLGYANMGRPSPYIWSGSNQYVSGKYVRDHIYDPHAIDTQLGCAPLLASMAKLASGIPYGQAKPPNVDIAPKLASVDTQPEPLRLLDDLVQIGPNLWRHLFGARDE